MFWLFSAVNMIFSVFADTRPTRTRQFHFIIDRNFQIQMESAKKAACMSAVAANVTSATRSVGIGSGSTIPYAIEALSKKNFPNITAFIPTSFQAIQLITQAGLPLSTANNWPEIDVAFDG
jgi:ribose 5-phosphate isomerase A